MLLRTDNGTHRRNNNLHGCENHHNSMVWMEYNELKCDVMAHGP